ncbi:5'-nucleotidase SurE [Desulfosarcina ovata subsp. sediminis]|uniref:5'-nucleotidase n=1 Tax=Desulfosarcina ovata subsp. sediminis TaxID=885957 RepID=A0A5K7ZVN7_9BACT|nr:5'/3'-nucleotidase SurE [Desulfosarcina ovata]BBO84313.1 5'-nucleotidase SurE [Desulfosarcina ovata subsp. sediminis]
MKIVITNDDGYDQPGLAALVQALTPLGEITVVAPAAPQSNVGHRVTMRDPIRVEQPNSRMYVVHATPADCTRLALKAFVPDANWVVAGINPGANLGSDVYQSGTVAAAREASILGVRAVAISQYIAPQWTIPWPAVQRLAAHLLPIILTQPLAIGQFWNINLPSPLDTKIMPIHRFCSLDKHPHHYRYSEENGTYHYHGIIHDRPRSTGSDVDVCFGGMISVTRLEI